MDEVYRCDAPQAEGLAELIGRYDIDLVEVEEDHPIPGSHFGDPEAGLIGNRLMVRKDTPIHSAFHETCHYICMDQMRRQNLHTDAGGDYDEENGVCYLQILLADHLPNYSSAEMMADMDSWGYTFRLGSAAAWFTSDAEDARAWLEIHHIIDQYRRPTWKLRKL